MTTLNLVGCGRVGQTLARLWLQHSTFAVQDVLTSSLPSAQAAVDAIGAGTAAADISEMRPADVWMLATPDAQLPQVAQALAEVVGAQGGLHSTATSPAASAAAARNSGSSAPAHAVPLVFHCSGALDISLLEPLAALGWRTASAHCLLSFASVQAALTQFPGTPCALEGDAAARDLLRPAFTAIGAQCFDVTSEHKLLYHAGAVFATNFIPVLQALAEDAWRSAGVPAHLLPGLRAALLHNAVANITATGPTAALTGPAARGDTAAIAHQGAAVADWDPLAGDAYRALSVLALRMAQSAPPKLSAFQP